MPSKIFLDTNIVLDIIVPNRIEEKIIVKLFDKLADYEIFISEDMLSTIYYIVKDKQKVLEFLETICDEWNVVSFENDVIKDAIKFSLTNKSDLEDTLQCFCAKKFDCNILLTNDKKFIDCGVNILDYDKFL